MDELAAIGSAKLAAISASTQLARFGLALRVREAVVDPLSNHLCHQWMQAERRGDEIAYALVLAGRGGGEPRNVFVPMPAGQEKIGDDDDRRCTARYAPRKRCVDRWLGQLHVRRLDDRKPGRGGKVLHDIEQHLVALVAPRAVIDENDAQLCIVQTDRALRWAHCIQSNELGRRTSSRGPMVIVE